MRTKHERSDASIQAEIRRLRNLLERRKLVRTHAALLEARREIETLRAQLQGVAPRAPAAPADPDANS